MGEQQVSDMVLRLVLETVPTAGAIYAILRTIGSTRLDQVALYRKISPLLPVILGVLAAVFGTVPRVSTEPLIARIVVGCWCGLVTMGARKILGQTILGDDSVIAKASAPKE